MAKKPSQMAAVVAAINPASLTANTYVTAYVDMKNFEQVLAVLMLGAMTATGTLDAKLRQATSGAGANVKDIPGKAVTQLTAAGTDSDKQVLINCRADELDVAGGFQFVALSVTTATAATIAGAALLGFNPTYGPASDYDLASVDEIVG